MRGTHAHYVWADGQWGIIPAYAGNTRSWKARTCSPWDHPRVCGEHRPSGSRAKGHRGSSPRMRGTLHRFAWRSAHAGIIPAYAGNTANSWLTADMLGDHPRVCGEHLTPDEAHRAGEGSSPRMRGTPSMLEHIGKFEGIIPAYAGNTDRTRSRCFVYRDHPRVCGEHVRFGLSR